MVILLRAILLLSLATPAAALGAVSADVDRTTVAEGETLVLRVRAEGDAPGVPNFAPLDKDFEILSRSQSSQTRIINWKKEEWREWTVVLAPRRTGALTIPAIRVGGEQTRPIAVQVTQAPTAAAGDDRPVFLEVETDRARVHVQSQVLLTVRVWHRQPLDGNLTEPEIEDAVIEQLGEQGSYETVRGGTRYTVVERRYAVFPQRSGSLEIPPLTLTGTLQPGNRLLNMHPFGPQGGRTVRIRSEIRKVEVLPRPDDWPATEPWLPAADLRLEENWSPAPPEFRVGEPVTRSIRIEARGLASSQLPDLAVEWPDGARVYPDAPGGGDVKGRDGITGTRTLSSAVIPTTGGTLQFPEVRVTWWNTRTQRREVSTLPARSFPVTGAAPAPAASAAKTPVEVIEPAQGAGTGSAIRPSTGAGAWQLASALLLVAWLVTLALWYRDRRQGHDTAETPSPRTNLGTPLKALRKACRANDASAARLALLDWAGQVIGTGPVPGLPGVAKQAATPALRNAVLELDDFLYGPSSTAQRTWNGAVLLECVNREILERRKEGSREEKDLPSLYPA